MSVRVMSQVWDLKLPHASKFVLLAMADHADHDGNNVYPSVRTVALKTGYSVRQVQRIITALEADGLLVAMQQAAGAATVYRIETSDAEKVETRRKPARFAPAAPPVSAANNSPEPMTKCHPCQNVTPDIHDIKNGQNVIPTPDILSSALIPIKEPSYKPSYEPSGRVAPVSAEKPKLGASSIADSNPEKDGSGPSAQSNPSAQFNTSAQPQAAAVAKTPPPSSQYPADMMTFWESYPPQGRTRGSLKELQTNWQKLSAAQKAEAMSGLHAALQTAQFREYPKAPHRWVQGRCWEVFLGDLSPLPVIVLASAQAETSAFAAGSAERAARFSELRKKANQEGRPL